MSKLQELIDRLCPDGVDFKPLGEVCEMQPGDTLSSKAAIEGDVPVMAGGQQPSCYHNVANRSGETIVVDMEKCIEYADNHNLIFAAITAEEIKNL